MAARVDYLPGEIMTTEQWQLAESLFHTALELPRERWEEWLVRNCPGDEAIADALHASQHRTLYIALTREILAVAAARGALAGRIGGASELRRAARRDDGDAVSRRR